MAVVGKHHFNAMDMYQLPATCLFHWYIIKAMFIIGAIANIICQVPVRLYIMSSSRKKLLRLPRFVCWKGKRIVVYFMRM